MGVIHKLHILHISWMVKIHHKFHFANNILFCLTSRYGSVFRKRLKILLKQTQWHPTLTSSLKRWQKPFLPHQVPRKITCRI